MGYQTLQVFIDIVEWVEWLWADHWVQLLNAFGVLLAVSIFFLLNEAWGQYSGKLFAIYSQLYLNLCINYSDEQDRLEFEKHERIKREAIKRAKEIIEEEKREMGSKKGRRIFKVVSYTKSTHNHIFMDKILSFDHHKQQSDCNVEDWTKGLFPGSVKMR